MRGPVAEAVDGFQADIEIQSRYPASLNSLARVC